MSMVTRRIVALGGFFLLAWGLLDASPAMAQQPQWIWYSAHQPTNVPQTSCHFRKVFSVTGVKSAVLLITADDSYEVFLNGSRIGRGTPTGKLDRYSVTARLARGRNVLAVKVKNSKGKTAGLAVSLQITLNDGKAQRIVTDATWRTYLRPLPLWNTALYNDRRWPTAKRLGALGSTPTLDKARIGRDDVLAGNRNKGRTGGGPRLVSEPTPVPQEGEERTVISLPEDFRIERLFDDDKVGSLIAMAFNEFGHIVASRENGPLLLIYDTDDDGVLDGVRTYCDQVRNCQGILPLNGDVYVTGDGPDGVALYRLSDVNRDGRLEKIRAIVKFSGTQGEHGVHGLRLGPDGMIYIVVGNHTQAVDVDEEMSPHQHVYEGDLVPRFEDPGGHAVGIKAPAGTVLRTDTEGQTIERVAGGLRNPYDLTFDRYGSLFVHDSDMESDLGAPWYAPTRMFQIVEGGEYGWRSGWAKWPEYYIDRLPTTLTTGRGSPTGAVTYDHFQFPKRYHNAIFLADWSEGRIISVKLRRDGAGYKATSEDFITGQPLNITDLDIGPKGSMYFITGGRDTAGALYKVTWKGVVPSSISNIGSGMTAVVRQPQLHSAWARQAIAEAKEEIGDAWDRQLQGVARSQSNSDEYRIRALDIMQWFGPAPTALLVDELAHDPAEEIRAKAASLMSLHAFDDSRDLLIDLLKDKSALVRRTACEALARSRINVPADLLLASLASKDRWEAWAARQLLRQLPQSQWRSIARETQNHDVFNQVALALLSKDVSAETAVELIDQIGDFFDETISDAAFVDMLRIVQLAIHRGKLSADNIPVFADRIADEYPTSGNSAIDRELVRLIAGLDNPRAIDRMLAKLKANDVSDQDKIHLGLHMIFITHGWTSDSRKQLLEFLRRARELDGGGSYVFYIDKASKLFAKTLGAEDSRFVLDNASRWPSAALGALYSLPDDIDANVRASLIRLDREIERETDEPYRSLKVGIVAILARSKQAESMAYLRDIWERDPERRQTVAMGLSQQPAGENWPLLVRSLSFVDGDAATEVVRQLLNVPKAPAEPEYIRAALVVADKLGKHGARDAIELIEYWTGEKPEGPFNSLQDELVAWQEWFRVRHPDLPAARAPHQAPTNKWVMSELLRDISSKEQYKRVSITNGAVMFRKAQCSKCHRLGGEGTPQGPDLTNLHKRFMRKEVMESILFPNQTISNQYASTIVVASDGKTYTGLLSEVGDEYVVSTSTGAKVSIAKDRVEKIISSPTSVMPSGLLDELSVDEIADLFAYMGMLGNKANIARSPTVRKAR
jgi:putative heme-binding domain-containing protein